MVLPSLEEMQIVKLIATDFIEALQNEDPEVSENCFMLMNEEILHAEKSSSLSKEKADELFDFASQVAKDNSPENINRCLKRLMAAA